MSSENDALDSEESVLRYRSAGPSVVISRHPSPEDLAFDWTLSDADKVLLLENRGAVRNVLSCVA